MRREARGAKRGIRAHDRELARNFSRVLDHRLREEAGATWRLVENPSRLAPYASHFTFPLMHCPFCGHTETRVADSRLAAGGRQIRRRRVCLECEARFTTQEKAELALPRVVKRDGSRVPFDEQRLRLGILKALEKRPVATETVDAMIGSLLEQLRLGEAREVTSAVIGDMVMEALFDLDQVAYVRFASVYRSFQDVEAFRREIDQLKHARKRPGRHKREENKQLSLLGDERRRPK
ncbi:MAG: transcriptional regulator NrdR [Gammaproteobacteria bacterium]